MATIDIPEDKFKELIEGEGIPTLMVFRDGIMVFREAGALPPAALEDLITQVKALDMDEVRAQVENQQGEQAE